MLSQWQNPPDVQQQMGSNDTENISKPFSIREYVLSARQKDIFHNWPFPKEYLQVCMRHGISRVLPPFEPRDSVETQFHRTNFGLSVAQERKEHAGCADKNFVEIGGEQEIFEVVSDECMDEVVLELSKQVFLLSLSANGYKHGEEKYLSSDIIPHPIATHVHPSTTKPGVNNQVDQSLAALPSTNKSRGKRKNHKGKLKKRSMVDIYAKARSCTVKDMDRIDESNIVGPTIMPCGSNRVFMKTVDGENGSMNVVERGCRSKLMEGFWKKHLSDDNAVTSNMLAKKRCIKKIKLNASKSKSWKRKLNSFGTVENKMNYYSTSNLEVQRAFYGQRKENLEGSGAS